MVRILPPRISFQLNLVFAMVSSTTTKLKWWIIGLPLFVTFVWHNLDASPTLFFYNLLYTQWMTTSASLVGKTVWITGASSGIGASLVCQVMQHGAEHGALLFVVVCCCLLLRDMVS